MTQTFLMSETVRRSPRRAGPPTKQRLLRATFADWQIVRSSEAFGQRKVVEERSYCAQSSPASSIDMRPGKSYAIVATYVSVRIASLAAGLRFAIVRRDSLLFSMVAVGFTYKEGHGLQQ